MSQDATQQPMSKAYSPAEHESRIWDKWAASGAFHADPARVLSGEARPYAILIPPPNVTAALHLGHALNNSIQDILIRAHRMMGYETLWMPGTDHAGIATQTMVDKKLREQGQPGIAEYKKKELAGESGREEFLKLVYDFKDNYEARITNQLKKMGCSCDWERQRFTMDDICARAVREAFFRLFRDGLIYRGKRLVNWDPVTQTALADDEVEMEEIDGFFWYMKYPIIDDAGRETGAFVTVATTRPETFFGDTAVAVNPDDTERAACIGKRVRLPFVGREIPILGDDYVVPPDAESSDPKARFATGFLKVTPAHDPNDYMIGQRHGLPVINIMAPDASISDQHGWEDVGDAGRFIGLSREDARNAVEHAFRDAGLLADKKPYRHSVGHSYRSHAPVEPYLSDQWYCKVTDDKLRGNAQRALKLEQRTEASLQAWPESTPLPGGPARRAGSSLHSLTALSYKSDSIVHTDKPLHGVAPDSFKPADPFPPSQVRPSDLRYAKRDLPHLQIPGATYFVTWRAAQGRNLDIAARTLIAEALEHRHGDTAVIDAVVIMTDHAHMLLRLNSEEDLSSWMSRLKRFTARTVNETQKQAGSLWQDEHFDRIVRDENEYVDHLTYLIDNPREAGLAHSRNDWDGTLVGSHMVEQLQAQVLPEEPGSASRATAKGTTDGAMTFSPARYARTYETWHDNLRDWCISRQLWWGHRIPVWSWEPDARPDKLSESDAEMLEALNSLQRAYPDHLYFDESVFSNKIRIPEVFDLRGKIGDEIPVRLVDVAVRIHCPELEMKLEGLGFTQDPDVLDTWFSSALWPLSTMGWPDPSAANADDERVDDFESMLKAFNPTSVLTTAREIITLWVSRMVMFNRYFGRSALRADSSQAIAGSDAHVARGLEQNDQAPSQRADLRRLTDLSPDSVDADDLRMVRPKSFIGRDPYPPDAPSPRDMLRKDRRLPHIELDKATYFVTWKTREGQFLDDAEQEIVADAIAHWHERGCETYAFTVMSNHVHALVRLDENVRLTQWCSSIKKFSATRINERRGDHGSLWQPDRFDHVVRNEDDFNEFLSYIIRNGTEANAVSRPSEDRFCFLTEEVAKNLGGLHSVPTGSYEPDATSMEEDPARSAGLPPFKDVFIHAMIQDGEGRKMSKSLGNGVDPLDIIDSHGADAMRFTLCQMTTQTQDVRMPVEPDPVTGKNTSPKFDLGRNLCNKLWNAAKFTEMMLDKTPPGPALPIDPQELALVDRWMLSRVVEATNKVNTAMRSYMFKDYADTLYDLFWRDFCDWHLESIKPTIEGNPNQAAVLRLVFEAILRLMHPVMPFITETLAERFASIPIPEITGFAFAPTRSNETLCQSGWPMPDHALRDEVAEEAYERLRALVSTIREVRAQSQVPPKRKITLHASGALARDIARWSPLVETLAGVGSVDQTPSGSEPQGQSAAFTFEGAEYRLSNLADALDAGAERERLKKELASIDKSISGIRGRLSNPGYADKAPAHLVEQTRAQLAQLEKDRDATSSALGKL